MLFEIADLLHSLSLYVPSMADLPAPRFLSLIATIETQGNKGQCSFNLGERDAYNYVSPKFLRIIVYLLFLMTKL